MRKGATLTILSICALVTGCVGAHGSESAATNHADLHSKCVALLGQEMDTGLEESMRRIDAEFDQLAAHHGKIMLTQALKTIAESHVFLRQSACLRLRQHMTQEEYRQFLQELAPRTNRNWESWKTFLAKELEKSESSDSR